MLLPASNDYAPSVAFFITTVCIVRPAFQVRFGSGYRSLQTDGLGARYDSTRIPEVPSRRLRE